jgi:hypothetical protein
MTRALLQHCPSIQNHEVIEPCAGAFAMGDVLASAGGCEVSAFDIEPRSPFVYAADTLAAGFFESIACDRHRTAVITNTPFSLASDYWRQTQGFGLVALLVRITWLEACKDREDVRDPDDHSAAREVHRTWRD